MVFNRIGISGSLIGGIKETQEVLDLCAKHDIAPSIKTIAIQDINNIMQVLEKGNDSEFRHVIDMQSLHDAVEKMKDEVKQLDRPDRGEVVNRKAV